VSRSWSESALWPESDLSLRHHCTVRGLFCNSLFAAEMCGCHSWPRGRRHLALTRHGTVGNGGVSTPINRPVNPRVRVQLALCTCESRPTQVENENRARATRAIRLARVARVLVRPRRPCCGSTTRSWRQADGRKGSSPGSVHGLERPTRCCANGHGTRIYRGHKP
jgi:hypothetical protein